MNPTEKTVPVTAGWLHRFAPRTKREAYEKQAARVNEAGAHRDKVAANPRATQAKKDEAKIAHLDELDKLMKLSDDLLAWRAENVERVTAEVRQRQTERAQAALALVDQVQSVLQDIADEGFALNFFRNDHPIKRDTKLMSAKRIPGGESLPNLRTGIESLLPQPEPRTVSPRAMALLQAGRDVEDVDGEPLDFATADALHRKGLLILNPGKPLPVHRREVD
jgi:hypothetical protein